MYKSIVNMLVEDVNSWRTMAEWKKQKIKEWINKNYTKQLYINYDISSYELKHECEKEVDFYVSNDDIKLALLEEGYKAKSYDKSNVNYINWAFNLKRR